MLANAFLMVILLTSITLRVLDISNVMYCKANDDLSASFLSFYTILTKLFYILYACNFEAKLPTGQISPLGN